MNRSTMLIAVSLGFCCAAASVDSSASEQLQPATPLRIGGTGGVYFLASPGTLVVELEKNDRNRRRRHTDLRAILVGPDRQVIQDVTIPDAGEAATGQLGKPHRVRLSADVKSQGVFGLNVTVSQDRYGDAVAWAFQTNCPFYLIETSRGHRDERHQEPIVLLSPDRSGEVCFMPRDGAFQIDITDLPATTRSVEIRDSRGKTIDQFVASDGRASHEMPQDKPRDHVPWSLWLPTQQATVHIDGVTRWGSGDRNSDLCWWTPTPSSWFPLLENRWLVTPYAQKVFGRHGENLSADFTVMNNAERTRVIDLAIEFPDDPWQVELSKTKVRLAPGKSEVVSIKCRVPREENAAACRLKANVGDPTGFSTYATLTVVPGTPPVENPLVMPVRLRPYEHENHQFGYLPEYPVERQMYFDVDNQPHCVAGAGIASRENGSWTTCAIRDTLRPRPRAAGIISTKLAFDQDATYTLGRIDGQNVLLRSLDAEQSWSATPIPGRTGSFDLEQFSGHNTLAGPPPIVRYVRTASDPKLRWRSVHDLELILAQVTDGGLEIAEPVMVSRQCIGSSSHSGIPSTVVSRGTKVHVAWAEATDPDEKVAGVPTFVATYDREKTTLGNPVLVGYGAPPNDIHNTPSITIDSQGFLHVLVGTHGRPFMYARSLRPNDSEGGWTDPVPIGENMRQTYIGFVCGKDDSLHVVYRMWRSNIDPSPHSTHATLAYSRKLPGKAWEPPKVLVVAPFSEYSIFYHRLTIDRSARLFLSYDYWSTYWFYRNDHRGTRRAVLMSPDNGESWKLAGSRDW